MPFFIFASISRGFYSIQNPVHHVKLFFKNFMNVYLCQFM